MPEPNVPQPGDQHVQHDGNVAQNAPAPTEQGGGQAQQQPPAVDPLVQRYASQFGARSPQQNVDSSTGAEQQQSTNPDDPQFQAFNQQLQTYLGVDASQLRNIVNRYQSDSQFIEQQRIQQERSQLQSAWGDQFNDNFNAVQERLAQLHQQNPQLAASLNNAQGAQMVLAQIQQERLAQQQATQVGVPNFDRTYVPSSPNRTQFAFTKSQLDSMSEQDKAARWGEIGYAYANGLVDFNN